MLFSFIAPAQKRVATFNIAVKIQPSWQRYEDCIYMCYNYSNHRQLKQGKSIYLYTKVGDKIVGRDVEGDRVKVYCIGKKKHITIYFLPLTTLSLLRRIPAIHHHYLPGDTT